MNNKSCSNSRCSVLCLMTTGLILLLTIPCMAQRDYFFRDSTVYPVNTSVKYIAGKYVLYKQTNSTILPIRDFSVTGDTTFYIRDVDFINEQKGYVLVGRMYIGGETYLYKTLNGGTTWQLDTSYYQASKHKSINQVQLLDDHTFVLFDGYYESALIRSFDGGQTWKMWFESLIAHYFQLHRCSNTTWYLIGTPGDGFTSYSFPIPDTLWEKEDIYFMSGCHNGAPDCIRVWRDGDRDRATDFIAKQRDTLSKVCGNITGIEQVDEQRVVYYPNPFTDYLYLFGAQDAAYELYNLFGKCCLQGVINTKEFVLPTSSLPKGTYILRINHRYYKVVKS